jgi:hypothetical protein
MNLKTVDHATPQRAQRIEPLLKHAPAVPVLSKNHATEGAARQSAPAFRATKRFGCFFERQSFRGRTLRDRNAPGRAALFFAYFLLGGIKRK